jgi:hypothetical protein
VNDGKLFVHLSDQGEEHAEWEGDNRERSFPGNKPWRLTSIVHAMA